MEIERIAWIETGYEEKFGVPRQSGLVRDVGRIIFEPKFRVPEAFRGIEEFSHLWLIWGFSEDFASKKPEKGGFSPTVRPPRLGGNSRVGVFATRSPNRPNRLGLSAVKLLKYSEDKELGPTLLVEGADMVSGSPIYDVKPYLKYADSLPGAVGGFAEKSAEYRLSVDFPEELRAAAGDRTEAISEMISQDPRPHYQDDPERIYRFRYRGLEVGFRVFGDRAEVTEVAEG